MIAALHDFLYVCWDQPSIFSSLLSSSVLEIPLQIEVNLGDRTDATAAAADDGNGGGVGDGSGHAAAADDDGTFLISNFGTTGIA